jgi:casein kinase 1
MYFFRGSLPWQGLKFHRKDDKFKKIYAVKKNTSTEELSKGYPGTKNKNSFLFIIKKK